MARFISSLEGELLVLPFGLNRLAWFAVAEVRYRSEQRPVRILSSGFPT